MKGTVQPPAGWSTEHDCLFHACNANVVNRLTLMMLAIELQKEPVLRPGKIDACDKAIPAVENNHLSFRNR
jgi:hypothetical protein